MLTLKCTKKVQDFLGIKPSDIEILESDNTLLGAWYVHQIIIERRKVLIFVNENTLLSFIVSGVTKTNTKKINFNTLFLYHFFNLMKLIELPTDKAEDITEDYYQVRFSKTDNRKVLGNLNDLAFLYHHYIQYDGGLAACDIDDIIVRVNQTPQRNLGSSNSISIAKEILSSVPL